MLVSLLKILSKWLDTTIKLLGVCVSWLTLFMVITVVLVLVLRNFFDLGAIALQESITYMHAMVFMLGSAYTLQTNDHVRVDVFYQRFSQRKKAWVDLLGFIFLLIPVCWFIYHYSINTVALNWALKTGSNSPGGLPYVYLLMGLLLLLPISLFMQGLSNAIKNILLLTAASDTANKDSTL